MPGLHADGAELWALVRSARSLRPCLLSQVYQVVESHLRQANDEAPLQNVSHLSLDQLLSNSFNVPRGGSRERLPDRGVQVRARGDSMSQLQQREG